MWFGFFGKFALRLEERVGPGTRAEFCRWRVVGGVVTEVIPVCEASGVAKYFFVLRWW